MIKISLLIQRAEKKIHYMFLRLQSRFLHKLLICFVGNTLYNMARVRCKALECFVNYVVCKMCPSLTFLYFPRINVGAPLFFPVRTHMYSYAFYVCVTTLTEYVNRKLRANALMHRQINPLSCRIIKAT